MKFGAVSWVLPRGTYLENARVLEPLVDFTELLVYTWDSELQKLLAAELPGLRELDLFYTVHLPLDTIDNCKRAYEFFAERRFPIRNYTLHPVKGWESFIGDKPEVSLENLIEASPLYPRMTLDVGHLILSGRAKEFFESGSVTELRELHLHGVRGKKDHVRLNAATLRTVAAWADRYPLLRDFLASAGGLANFEIFELDKFTASLQSFLPVGTASAVRRGPPR